MSFEFSLMIVLTIAFSPIIILLSAFVVGTVIDVIFCGWFTLFVLLGMKRPLQWWRTHSVILSDRRFKE